MASVVRDFRYISESVQDSSCPIIGIWGLLLKLVNNIRVFAVTQLSDIIALAEAPGALMHGTPSHFTHLTCAIKLVNIIELP